MGLPTRRFHQLLGCRSARPLQQFEDFGGLDAVPCGTALLFAPGDAFRFTCFRRARSNLRNSLVLAARRDRGVGAWNGAGPFPAAETHATVYQGAGLAPRRATSADSPG